MKPATTAGIIIGAFLVSTLLLATGMRGSDYGYDLRRAVNALERIATALEREPPALRLQPWTHGQWAVTNMPCILPPEETH